MECESVGSAGWPIWLEDGGIAFLAPPNAATYQGFDRLEAASFIFGGQLDRGEATLLSSCSFRHGRALTSLPGDGSVIVSGEIPGLGDGTWIAKLGTSSVSLISDRAFDWLATDDGSIYGLSESVSVESGAILETYDLEDVSLRWVRCPDL
jgi:hypothetical protein